MRDLVYRPVCDARGGFLPWLRELRNQSGAYVIRGAASRRCLYVGESHTGNLAKTIKRHTSTRGATTPSAGTTPMTAAAWRSPSA